MIFSVKSLRLFQLGFAGIRTSDPLSVTLMSIFPALRTVGFLLNFFFYIYNILYDM